MPTLKYAVTGALTRSLLLFDRLTLTQYITVTLVTTNSAVTLQDSTFGTKWEINGGIIVMSNLTIARIKSTSFGTYNFGATDSNVLISNTSAVYITYSCTLLRSVVLIDKQTTTQYVSGGWGSRPTNSSITIQDSIIGSYLGLEFPSLTSNFTIVRSKVNTYWAVGGGSQYSALRFINSSASSCKFNNQFTGTVVTFQGSTIFGSEGIVIAMNIATGSQFYFLNSTINWLKFDTTAAISSYSLMDSSFLFHNSTAGYIALNGGFVRSSVSFSQSVITGIGSNNIFALSILGGFSTSELYIDACKITTTSWYAIQLGGLGAGSNHRITNNVLTSKYGTSSEMKAGLIVYTVALTALARVVILSNTFSVAYGDTYVVSVTGAGQVIYDDTNICLTVGTIVIHTAVTGQPISIKNYPKLHSLTVRTFGESVKVTDSTIIVVDINVGTNSYVSVLVSKLVVTTSLTLGWGTLTKGCLTVSQSTIGSFLQQSGTSLIKSNIFIERSKIGSFWSFSSPSTDSTVLFANSTVVYATLVGAVKTTSLLIYSSTFTGVGGSITTISNTLTASLLHIESSFVSYLSVTSTATDSTLLFSNATINNAILSSTLTRTGVFFYNCTFIGGGSNQALTLSNTFISSLLHVDSCMMTCWLLNCVYVPTTLGSNSVHRFTNNIFTHRFGSASGGIAPPQGIIVYGGYVTTSGLIHISGNSFMTTYGATYLVYLASNGGQIVYDGMNTCLTIGAFYINTVAASAPHSIHINSYPKLNSINILHTSTATMAGEFILVTNTTVTDSTSIAIGAAIDAKILFREVICTLVTCSWGVVKNSSWAMQDITFRTSATFSGTLLQNSNFTITGFKAASFITYNSPATDSFNTITNGSAVYASFSGVLTRNVFLVDKFTSLQYVTISWGAAVSSSVIIQNSNIGSYLANSLAAVTSSLLSIQDSIIGTYIDMSGSSFTNSNYTVARSKAGTYWNYNIAAINSTIVFMNSSSVYATFLNSLTRSSLYVYNCTVTGAGYDAMTISATFVSSLLHIDHCTLSTTINHVLYLSAAVPAETVHRFTNNAFFNRYSSSTTAQGMIEYDRNIQPGALVHISRNTFSAAVAVTYTVFITSNGGQIIHEDTNVCLTVGAFYINTIALSTPHVIHINGYTKLSSLNILHTPAMNMTGESIAITNSVIGACTIEVGASMDLSLTMNGTACTSNLYVTSGTFFTKTVTNSTTSVLTLTAPQVEQSEFEFSYNVIADATLHAANSNTNVTVSNNAISKTFTLGGYLKQSIFNFSNNKVISKTANSFSVTLTMTNSIMLLAFNYITTTLTNAMYWSTSPATNTTILMDNNTIGGQAAFEMTTANILENSTLWLTRNIFFATSSDQVSMRVRLQGGRLLHDETNQHQVGIVAVHHTGNMNGDMFTVDRSSFASFIYSQTTTLLAVGNYVRINRCNIPSVTVSFGQTVGTSLILNGSTISTSATLSMNGAADSDLGIQSSTVTNPTLTGSLSRNSSIFIRTSTTIGLITISPISTCTDSFPCLIEVKENSMVSASTNTLTVTGPIGDGSLLNIQSNSMVCTGNYIPLYFNNDAIRLSGGLSVLSNTITSKSASYDAVAFSSSLSFTGSLDIWGNTLFNGAFKLAIGAAPSAVNFVGNVGPSFVFSGSAPTTAGSRTVSCSTQAGTSFSNSSIGFTTVACDNSNTVGRCGHYNVVVTEPEISSCLMFNSYFQISAFDTPTFFISHHDYLLVPHSYPSIGSFSPTVVSSTPNPVMFSAPVMNMTVSDPIPDYDSRAALIDGLGEEGVFARMWQVKNCEVPDAIVDVLPVGKISSTSSTTVSLAISRTVPLTTTTTTSTTTTPTSTTTPTTTPTTTSTSTATTMLTSTATSTSPTTTSTSTTPTTTSTSTATTMLTSTATSTSPSTGTKLNATSTAAVTTVVAPTTSLIATTISQITIPISTTSIASSATSEMASTHLSTSTILATTSVTTVTTETANGINPTNSTIQVDTTTSMGSSNVTTATEPTDSSIPQPSNQTTEPAATYPNGQAVPTDSNHGTLTVGPKATYPDGSPVITYPGGIPVQTDSNGQPITLPTAVSSVTFNPEATNVTTITDQSATAVSTETFSPDATNATIITDQSAAAQEIQTSSKVIGVVSSLIFLISDGSSIEVQIMTALMLSAPCASEWDRNSMLILRYFLSPFVDFGSAAVIFTHFGIVALVVVLHFSITCIIRKLKVDLKSEDGEKTGHWRTVFSYCCFPALPMLAASFLFTGVAVATAESFVSKDRVDIVVSAVLGIPLLVTIPGFSFWVTRNSNAKFEPVKCENIFERFVKPQGHWVPANEYRLIYFAHGWIRGYPMRFVSLFLPYGVSIILSIIIVTVTNCAARYIAVCVVTGVVSIAIAVLRPHRSIAASMLTSISFFALSLLSASQLVALSVGEHSNGVQAFRLVAMIVLLIAVVVRSLHEVLLICMYRDTIAFQTATKHNYELPTLPELDTNVQEVELKESHHGSQAVSRVASLQKTEGSHQPNVVEFDGAILQDVEMEAVKQPITKKENFADFSDGSSSSFESNVNTMALPKPPVRHFPSADSDNEEENHY